MARMSAGTLRRLSLVALALLTGGVSQLGSAADDLSKPLAASPNGHFLMQPDGSPFFWQGDLAMSLVGRLDRREADIYLQERARQGFNVIFTAAIGSYALSRPERSGDVPLIDRDPNRPNTRYFENLDWIVKRAAHYGLRVALMPVWGLQYVVEVHSKIFDPANAETFGRWIGARYKGDGIVWVLGGDVTPLWGSDWDYEKGGTSQATVIDYRPVFDAMAKGIAEGEGGHPFITYHMACCSWSGTADPRTSLYFRDRAWLGMNMINSSKFLHPATFLKVAGLQFGWNATLNYEPIAAEYASKPTRPVVDGGSRIDGVLVDEGYGPQAHGRWSAYDSRNAAYHSVFAGAAGYTYGNGNVDQFYDPAKGSTPSPEGEPWRQALSSAGARQMQYIKALMLSRPYFSRIPDQTLIVGDARAGTAHVSGTRDMSGSYAMVYLPSGGAVTVDLSKLSGRMAAGWWFNPRSGQVTPLGGRFSTHVTRRFTTPTAGEQDDWVLVLDDESRGFAPPGRH